MKNRRSFLKAFGGILAGIGAVTKLKAKEPELPPIMKDIQYVREKKNSAIRNQEYELASRFRDVECYLMREYESGVMNFPKDVKEMIEANSKIWEKEEKKEIRRFLGVGNINVVPKNWTSNTSTGWKPLEKGYAYREDLFSRYKPKT